MEFEKKGKWRKEIGEEADNEPLKCVLLLISSPVGKNQKLTAAKNTQLKQDTLSKLPPTVSLDLRKLQR